MKKTNTKKNIVILVVLLFIGLALIIYTQLQITPSKDHLLIIYGEESYDLPTCTTTLFHKEVDLPIKESNNIDLEHIGNYEIKYSTRAFHIIPKSISIPVEVIDIEAPVLELGDSTICFTKTNEEISLPDYEVSDNYDESDAIQVEVKGNFSVDQSGIYEARLIATDTSNNTTSKTITVVVGDISNQDFNVENFDLDTYLTTSNVITPTNKINCNYDDLYYIGDSNMVNFATYNGLPSNRVFARFALSPASFDLPVFYNNVQRDNIVTLSKRIKPCAMILTMGLNEVPLKSPIKLVDHYKTRIHELQESSPDSLIIVSSIFPVTTNPKDTKASQKQINMFNYCLYQMCVEEDLPFINVDPVYKDNTGYANSDYYLEDGYHIKGAYFNLYNDYIRSLTN